jgi:hypothetical protein
MRGFSFVEELFRFLALPEKPPRGKDSLLLQRGWKKILQRLAESCQLLES